MITTTHAKPLTSVLAAGLLTPKVAYCGRCSRVLGMPLTESERLALEHRHRCARPVKSLQPSIAVPFS